MQDDTGCFVLNIFKLNIMTNLMIQLNRTRIIVYHEFSYVGISKPQSMRPRISNYYKQNTCYIIDIIL